MSTRSTLTTMLTIAFIYGCDGTTTAVPPAVEVEWQGDVTGVGEWDLLTAEAAMRWTEGDQFFTAGIVLSGDEPGAVRPWHVHFGTCGTGGGIVGQDGDYPRLVIGPDGTASAVVDVPFVPDPTVPYHVNVHLSDEEMDVIIACGDIGTDTNDLPPPTIPGY